LNPHQTNEEITLSPEVHLVLLHHPVVNKGGEIVSTAVTNLDIHDNARSSRTFGLKSYHIVTPLQAQVELVSRILKHWKEGFGARRVPNRVDAMELVQVSESLEEAIETIMGDREGKPVVISTCARQRDQVVTFEDIRERMNSEQGPFVLVFGTGYGLAEEVLASSDAVLEPIGDPGDWNHLSVRSAVAIVLDRLLSRS
jgi:hypothetical protein